MAIEDLLDIVGDAQDVLDQLEEIFEQNPAVYALVATAFAKLQELIKDARKPNQPERAVTADDIRALAQGAVKNLKESQSSLEQFIEFGLDSSEELIKLIASLIGLKD